MADTTPPTSTGVKFTETAANSPTKSTVTLYFSEAVAVNGTGVDTAAANALKSLLKVDLISAPSSPGGSPLVTPIALGNLTGLGTATIAIETTSNIVAGSVIRVTFPDPADTSLTAKLTDYPANNQIGRAHV